MSLGSFGREFSSLGRVFRGSGPGVQDSLPVTGLRLSPVFSSTVQTNDRLRFFFFHFVNFGFVSFVFWGVVFFLLGVVCFWGLLKGFS